MPKSCHTVFKEQNKNKISSFSKSNLARRKQASLIFYLDYRKQVTAESCLQRGYLSALNVQNAYFFPFVLIIRYYMFHVYITKKVVSD